MSDDLFSAGFAWGDDDDVSQVVATPVATPEHAPLVLADEGVPSHSKGRVASVASVATTSMGNHMDLVSHVAVADSATPVATPETADFCGVATDFLAPVAGVASVADWQAGVEAFARRRTSACDCDLRAIQADATTLMRLWGADLHAAGWSTLEVWGSNADPSARRMDRLGLVHFLAGGRIEGVDSDTATIAHGRDYLTFYRRMVAAGGVPIWAVSAGESRREGPGEAPSALPPTGPGRQAALGDGGLDLLSEGGSGGTVD